MSEQTSAGGSIVVQGVRVPRFMYGTAWKEARTEELARAALEAGFRAIDTANQRKHYLESGVGSAVQQSGVARSELFLQTKFTYVRGQDQRLPYDPAAPIALQVRQSFESSLVHLGVTFIDSYVLHGPWLARGWSEQDRQAWGAMEELRREGRVHLLGVSNVSLEQLELLCARARVAPAFVQNRCYAGQGWDRAVRRFCRAHGIVYQGFSLLTANRAELGAPQVAAIARRLEATVPQVVFRFALGVGMLPLTGTSDRVHMAQDLASAQLELTAEELTTLEAIGD
jgi:diketogulonate reductase-like aldo/keto reductase